MAECLRVSILQYDDGNIASFLQHLPQETCPAYSIGTEGYTGQGYREVQAMKAGPCWFVNDRWDVPGAWRQQQYEYKMNKFSG